ncbi:MAG: PDZ domain-containing protein [Aestuariibaculum sp.]
MIKCLSQNGYFKEEFRYNKSGIELEHYGVRLVREIDNSSRNRSMADMVKNEDKRHTVVIHTSYKLSLKPAYSIVELRKNSPAWLAGLQIGDIILSVNGKPTYNFTLQQVIYKFYNDAGKHIRLKIDRNGIEMDFDFILQDPFQ